MMKKKRLAAVLLLLAAAGIGLLCYAGRYRSYETYAAYASHGGRTPVPFPEQAENCRFVLRNLLIAKQYLYAFTLPEKAAADFEAELTESFRLDSAEENDLKYGYAHWYGKTAGACAGQDEGLDAFPLHLAFSRVTDRDVRGAKILVYSPTGSGSRSFGVLTFPDTREYICYEYLSR